MAAHANTLTHSAPQATANGAYFSRTYRQYCSLLNAIPNLPADASDAAVAGAQEAAEELRDNILSARPATLENLAIKLRVLAQDEKDALHCTGGDADTFNRFAMLAADLDCIMAAEGPAESGSAFGTLTGRSVPLAELHFPAPNDFAAKLAAFTGYDAAVKALSNPTRAEIEQADDNRFDALADLMEAKPRGASEAAAQLRVIIAQQSDFLSGETPTEQAIRAGLANVLAAVERLASERR